MVSVDVGCDRELEVPVVSVDIGCDDVGCEGRMCEWVWGQIQSLSYQQALPKCWFVLTASLQLVMNTGKC